MESVFPAGAFLVGQVEPVWNFDKAVQRPDGSRPQQLDKDTGQLMWQVPVLDMDPGAGNRDKTVVVKLVSAQQPVPPANKGNLPITPVVFEGLSITPWVDDSGQRPRLMYSIRATGFADEAPTAERKAA
ncbi:MAG: plasmid replication, integration and excision activator [Corynebacteriales bacterium]|uniref:plasmid replication, integration and excision activator n=1 Tax=Cutibacterium avidum TaxID=33010 RepID=UPI001C323BA4|nr:plasmid replication, integration and excision activator [Cutibacterium avidum]MBS6415485.1 plasmid replication, integration and excision activator [Mycobacteriales bacterium]BCQ03617.1 hypothetical protein TPCV4_20610 [Cutibacterium avidum]